MLNELGSFNEIGKQREIVYFLKSIIKDYPTTFRDLELLCMHSPENMILRLEALIAFFDFIGIIDIDEQNKSTLLNKKGLELQNQEVEQVIIESIIIMTIEEMFKYKILSSDSFSFDNISNSYLFRSEKLSLDWAAIRNLLIECNFLILRYINKSYILAVSEVYENILTTKVKDQCKKISLEKLKENLLKNQEAGEKAEQYVLQYEIRRLSHSENSKKVRQISSIDVAAGYDIVSFENEISDKYDRFIEVKATLKNLGFYWSKNEVETAKLLGSRYHLYLVDLTKIKNSDYEPLIISDPASFFKLSDDWIVETQTFFIRKI